MSSLLSIVFRKSKIWGKREVEKFEFELELAALLGKLPLEGLDFVGLARRSTEFLRVTIRSIILS
jgi:hypothetical protein